MSEATGTFDKLMRIHSRIEVGEIDWRALSVEHWLAAYAMLYLSGG